MADRNGYIGRAPGDSSVTIARQSYNVSGVTTDFTFASSYTPTLFDVYVNGAKLVNITDYAATDGNTFSLITAAQDGDVVEAVAYKAFNVVNPVSSAIGDLSVGGDLTVSGDIINSGIVTSIVAGDNISVSGGTGQVTITGLANTSNVIANTVSSGTLNVSGIATFGDNVSIAGTLTYEDVKNVDSVGLITARGGIEVSGIVTARTGYAVTYYGDGSKLTGIAAGGDTLDITSSLFA